MAFVVRFGVLLCLCVSLMMVNASAGFPLPWSAGGMSSSMLFNASSGGRSTGAASAGLPGFQLPDFPAFASGETACAHQHPDPTAAAAGEGASRPNLHLNLRSVSGDSWSRRESIVQSASRDSARVRSLHRRVTEKMNRNSLSRLRGGGAGATRRALQEDQKHLVVATLESGTSEGTGEYLMDVYLGSPPRHFSLILDTGSDLNWIQCLPCHDCFPQRGPHYDPAQSTSYQNLSCQDQRCGLVSSPNPPQPCRSPDQPCPYYYWYGDQSNTTGELALDVFTVNVTAAGADNDRSNQQQQQHTLLFGCGHWNRGLFHGAAGLLGLGRGPLSFTSQLRKLYGHSFSYCFVDRDSGPSVTGRLLLGKDRTLMEHPQLNFTSFVGGDRAKDSGETETFYYVSIKGVMVGDKLVEGIPADAWQMRSDGGGGTIIDSGTTLSYFVEPAYQKIKQAFADMVGARYPRMVDFPIPLEPCYNVSSSTQQDLQLPDLTIVFSDGALWRLPSKNCFVRLEDDLMCLAMLSTPTSSMSILGNYLQQNFHVLYDTEASRLGFAPQDCSRL